MYTYRCRVLRVIDGDTLVADIDLGFDVTTRQTVRLYGINCPELKGYTKEQGLHAKEFAARWVAERTTEGEWLELETVKDKREKYGRYLGIVKPVDTYNESLNHALVENGHAVVAEY